MNEIDESQAQTFADLNWTLPQFHLSPETAAVIVIDMQYYDGHPDHGFGAQAQELGRFDALTYYFNRLSDVVIPGMQRLLASARKLGVRVIYVKVGSLAPDGEDLCLRYRNYGVHRLTASDPRALDILDEVRPARDDIVITKPTQNVFVSTPIDQILRNLGVHQLIMTGIATNNCVESAIRTAADLSYECVLIEDCCVTFTQVQHEAALDNVDGNIGWVRRVDDVIRELTDAASARAGR